MSGSKSSSSTAWLWRGCRHDLFGVGHAVVFDKNLSHIRLIVLVALTPKRTAALRCAPPSLTNPMIRSHISKSMVCRWSTSDHGES